MKVLMIHNTYQIPGGEGVVARNEAANLRAAGHVVVEYTRSNADLADEGMMGKLAIPLRMTWARKAAGEVRELVRGHQPDVAHIHNTHFMISPAAVHVCADAGVPVVHTLHNYRLICPAATLFRDGRVCEDCVGRPVALPGVVHGCYRGSRLQTGALAAANTFHLARGTWDRVSRFITPTAFVRAKLIEGGLDGARIVAKPHFLYEDPGAGDLTATREPFMLYVGRFTAEKGTEVLLRAWANLPGVPLRVVGEGPLLADAERTLAANPGPVALLGRVPRETVYDLMRRATAVVVSSECYETFGMVVMEAFAVGTPVIASGHGALAELVTDGVTGLHFAPSDAGDLAAKVRQVWENPAAAALMRVNARAAFEAHYTAARNLGLLLDVYSAACEAAPR